MQTIIVGTPGPQGSKGDQGIQGPSGSLQASNSGSFNITGSLTISGSSALTTIGPVILSGSLDVTQGITGSLLGTASYADYALSASHEIVKEVSSSHADFADAALSSSYALTASYLDNYIPPFPYTGSAEITGSLGVTGSLQVTGGITGSLFGTASYAILPDGNLQVSGGVALDGTLRPLEDQQGNVSALYISTAIVSSNGTGGASSLAYGTDQARGTNSTVFGASTAYAESFAVAVGRGAQANQSSTTLGEDAKATGQQAIAIGRDANATGGASISIGRFALASDTNAISIGYLSDATTADSIAIGNGAQATGPQAISIGYNSLASGTGSIALGSNLTASLDNTLYTNNAIVSGSLTVRTEGNTTQATSVIYAGTGSLALVPSGSGAITAQVPDGTVTGGVARGTNAVDFQMSRTDALQSAAGPNSNILGGINNRANRLSGAVLNGNGNNSFGEYSVVLNGTSNTSGAFNNRFTTVINGESSNATVIHSIVSGNQSNATGVYAIALGDRSNASATNSFAVNGLASGLYSFSFGGTASETRSYAFGAANAYLRNMFSQGAESFQKTVQSSNLLAYKFGELTSATSTILSLDGTGITNLIIPPTSRTWNVRVKTVAQVVSITGTATGVGLRDSFMENKSILFKRNNSGTSSIVGVGTAEIISDTSMSTALMTYSVGVSQELALTFTAPTFGGGGTLGIRIVSKIELVEVG